MNTGKKVLSWERRRVILEAFNLYASKAPVNIEGAQQQAHRAWECIKKHLTEEEKNQLGTAKDHALNCGEGRGEHDAVCKGIREVLAERLLHGE